MSFPENDPPTGRLGKLQQIAPARTDRGWRSRIDDRTAVNSAKLMKRIMP